MINKDELLFVVDADNHPLPPLPRHEVHARKLWHRVAHIWILNSEGQILCQKRSILKDIHPGEWEAFFGGHQAASETELENALNELNEELGIKPKPKELKFYQIYKKVGKPPRHHNEMLYLYLYRWDGDIAKLKLEAEEVEKVEWKSRDEIAAKIKGKTKGWTQHTYESAMLDWIADQ